MRLLVTAFPGEGHLQPLLPLVRAARSAGHEVVVATGPDLAPAVERRGLPVWAAGMTMTEAFAGPAGLPPPPPGEDRWVTAGTRVFVPAAERLAADLLPRARQWAPDVVVSEVTELAGLAVAAACGARFVVHGLGPLPEPAHWPDVPAFPELCARWGLPGPDGGLLDAAQLDVCPPSLHLRGHGAGEDVRPLRPAAGDGSAGGADPEEPDRGVAEQVAGLPHGRAVLLTLGTVVNRQPGAHDAALAGLRELPVDVVVTVGPGVDPASLGPQPPHVLVAGYLPHAALLPLCAAVVSHAGAATLLAGYRHGLPQLLLPRGGDQFANTEVAVRAGAALGLQPPEVTAGAVAAAVERLLREPGLTAGARRVRAELEAMPPAEEVLAGLLGDPGAAGRDGPVAHAGGAARTGR